MKTNSTFIGVDIGGTKIFAARFTEKGVIEKKVQIPTEAKKDKEHVLKNIEHAIAEVLAPTVAAIGIGWPGFVNAETSVVAETSNIPAFVDVAVAEIIRQKFSIPSYIENDATLFAFAEAKIGKAKDYSHILGIILGTGTGAGIIANGEIYRGQDGFAGEIGYLSPDFTIETNSSFSGPELKKKFIDAGLNDDLEGHITSWKKQEGESYKIFETWLSQLSIWLTNMLLTLNPGIIVFGGGISTHILPALLPELKKKLNKIFTNIHVPLHTSFEISKLENAGALGAALFAREKYENSR